MASAQRLKAADRRYRVIRYRSAGFTFRQIAEAVGCSAATAQRDYMAVVHKLNEKTEIKGIRHLTSVALDTLQTQWWERAAHDSEALHNVLRIIDTRLKVFGAWRPPGDAAQNSSPSINVTFVAPDSAKPKPAASTG